MDYKYWKCYHLNTMGRGIFVIDSLLELREYLKNLFKEAHQELWKCHGNDHNFFLCSLLPSSAQEHCTSLFASFVKSLRQIWNEDVLQTTISLSRYLASYERLHFLGEDGDDNALDLRRSVSSFFLPTSVNYVPHNIQGKNYK